MTLNQFCKLNGIDKKSLKLHDSSEKRWSYMLFFDWQDRTYKYNVYGPPGFVHEISWDRVPKDVKLKLIKQ